MTDRVTSIAELRERVAAFAAERDWDKFHSPKNLAMALAVEVAEFGEIFQWKTEEESWAARNDRNILQRAREELADIAIFVLNLCNRLDIDLASAIFEKLDINANRYPADRVRGSAAKYTEYDDGSAR
jgi:NTP pyrophosphatase (non-canonical NTP hydrolase)